MTPDPNKLHRRATFFRRACVNGNHCPTETKRSSVTPLRSSAGQERVLWLMSAPGTGKVPFQLIVAHSTLRFEFTEESRVSNLSRSLLSDSGNFSRASAVREKLGTSRSLVKCGTIGVSSVCSWHFACRLCPPLRMRAMHHQATSLILLRSLQVTWWIAHSRQRSWRKPQSVGEI